MKRWLATGLIVVYLGALSFGVGCHTFNTGQGAHPFMYFIVWDMFCGWASYASNTHVVAEGESGKYYDLAPAPWGEFQPWGTLGRRHYDAFYNHGGRLAHNVLKNTSHEPITRVFVIEECWPKKYDLPDSIWKARYGDEPKDVQKYCRLRTELLPCGTETCRYASWLSCQNMRILSSNPRLQAESQAGKPMFMIESERLGRELSVVNRTSMPGMVLSPQTVGAPLGN